MKKADIINLIRCHYEHNEAAFRHQSVAIAQEFDKSGDVDLADYIIALVNDSNSFVPQSLGGGSDYLVPMQSKSFSCEEHLLFPSRIEDYLKDIANSSNNGLGVNKFLFHGEPGTGKTEAVKYIARKTGRELFVVSMAQLVDSYLGQTAKNVELVFSELNQMRHPEHAAVLFDEIDALAFSRTDSNDVREMGRATTAFLHGLDILNSQIMLFATTNLYSSLDKALLRRFDLAVSFDQYEEEDLERIAISIMEDYLAIVPHARSDKKLFRKILALFSSLPNPGDLRNMLKVAVVFSDQNEPYDYLRRLYRSATGRDPDDIFMLRSEGFTVREIERLSMVSKSTVSRKTSDVSYT
ncbi:MAG: ATP-binding protein [Eggerthellaceae bacterium]|nr:ATP-binding protein [Eggerthellaceae bacterium]